MRFLGYIWASIQIDTPWAMGHVGLQLSAWAIGAVLPLALAIGIYFRLNKTTLAMSAFGLIASISLLALWLVEMDHWMHAPPPTDCGRDACDNDGTIRSLFAAGALILPVIIPSVVVAPFLFFSAFRRVFRTSSLV